MFSVFSISLMVIRYSGFSTPSTSPALHFDSSFEHRGRELSTDCCCKDDLRINNQWLRATLKYFASYIYSLYLPHAQRQPNLDNSSWMSNHLPDIIALWLPPTNTAEHQTYCQYDHHCQQDPSYYHSDQFNHTLAKRWVLIRQQSLSGWVRVTRCHPKLFYDYWTVRIYSIKFLIDRNERFCQNP